MIAAGIALTCGSPDELTIDTFRAVHFGRDHMQTAGFANFFFEDNVGTAACHVGGDRDVTGTTSGRHDLGFLFVVFGIQNLMRNPLILQQQSKCLGGIDGRCSHQNRATGFDQSLNCVHDCIVFGFLRFEDTESQSFANAVFVRRDFCHFQAIRFSQFACSENSGSGHSRKMVVLPEETLDRDARGLTGCRCDRDQFFGLDRLMKPVLPFAAIHNSAGAFVDDHDLVLDKNIVAVTFESVFGCQSFLNLAVDAFGIHGA